MFPIKSSSDVTDSTINNLSNSDRSNESASSTLFSQTIEQGQREVEEGGKKRKYALLGDLEESENKRFASERTAILKSLRGYAELIKSAEDQFKIGSILECVSPLLSGLDKQFKRDSEIVLEVMEIMNLPLLYLSDGIWSNKDIMFKAIKEAVLALQKETEYLTSYEEIGINFIELSEDHIDVELWIDQQRKEYKSGKAIGNRIDLDNLINLFNREINLEIIPTLSSLQFNQSMNLWLNDWSITGQKKKAAEIIKEAFETKATALNLGFMGLSELPSCLWDLITLEQLWLNDNHLKVLSKEIGNLTQLRELVLKNNSLTLLPKEVGVLNKLELLSLSNNMLKRIPKEIEALKSLKELYLDYNQLIWIPKEIGELKSLKKLYLDYNQLIWIPKEIGALKCLQNLYLDYNQLTSIPEEMGKMSEIQTISLNYNEGIEELPLSLGNCPLLRQINIEETCVDQFVVDQILNSSLPKLLQSWLDAGDIKGKPEISECTDSEQNILRDWLIRLTDMSDDLEYERSLKAVLCDMLTSLKENREFKKSLFDQIYHNNENCEDRVAMAFNEIYTSWKVLTLSQEEKNSKQMLEVMVQGAKTATLRRILSGIITDHEIEKQKREEESVEIYLYYEIELKDQLNLLTVIERMKHRDLGDRDWINKGDLIEKVNASYFDDLIVLPCFITLCENDNQFKKDWGPKAEKYMDRMSALDDKKERLSSKEYDEKGRELSKRRERSKAKMMKKWVENNLKV